MHPAPSWRERASRSNDRRAIRDRSVAKGHAIRAFVPCQTETREPLRLAFIFRKLLNSKRLRFFVVLAYEVPKAMVPPTVPGATSLAGLYHMKRHVPKQFDEPVGIVISRGREPETTPRFSAYVWAPFQDDELEQEAQPA